jgi:hypothetical protein
MADSRDKAVQTIEVGKKIVDYFCTTSVQSLCESLAD